MHVRISGVRRRGERVAADVHVAGRPHAGLQAVSSHPKEFILALNREREWWSAFLSDIFAHPLIVIGDIK